MIYQTHQTGKSMVQQQADLLGNSLRNLYSRLRLHNDLLQRWLNSLRTVPQS